MQALRFNEFGDPAVLHVTDMPDPPATAQEAVIRVDSASVNPSDVKNVAGVMEGTVLPRIPGRDFAGVVRARRARTPADARLSRVKWTQSAGALPGCR
jgi:NADPH:quinone reductase